MMFEMRLAKDQGMVLSLLDCLLLGWNRRAANPRDKVFGILGLVDMHRATQDLPEQHPADGHANGFKEMRCPELLVPDYKKTVKQVFVECSQNVLSADKGLAGLSLSKGTAAPSRPPASLNWAESSQTFKRVFGRRKSDCDSEIQNLPSWVIDFTSTLLQKPLVYSYDHKFAAGGKTATTIEFLSSDRTKLELQGLIWDQVLLVGEEFSLLQPVGNQYFSGNFLRILLAIGPHYEATKETTLRALFRTLVADHPACHKVADETYLRAWGGVDFLNWLVGTMEGVLGAQRVPSNWASRAMERTVQTPIDPDLRSKRQKETLNEHQRRFELIKEVWEEFLRIVDVDGHVKDTCNTLRLNQGLNSFFVIFSNLYEHRRLFLTRKGLLGIGPRSLNSGDSIAILSGAAVPFAVRQIVSREDKVEWVIVGETYVHGLMGGEAIEGVEVEWAKIVLV
jgi:hypothetical protein